MIQVHKARQGIPARSARKVRLVTRAQSERRGRRATRVPPACKGQLVVLVSVYKDQPAIPELRGRKDLRATLA